MEGRTGEDRFGHSERGPGRRIDTMKRWLVALLLAVLPGVVLVIVIDSTRNPIAAMEIRVTESNEMDRERLQSVT